MEDTIYYVMIVIAQTIVGLTGAIHAMLNKRSSHAAAMWVVLCLMVPFAGPLAYFVLGVNRTQRRAIRLMVKRETENADSQNTPNLYDSCVVSELPPGLSDLKPLMRLTGQISPRNLVQGNLIEPLYHGDEAFPAMLEAILNARETITCCSYIFDHDRIGRQLITAFSDAVKRGVKVHLLIDGVGGHPYFSRVFRSLRRYGVEPATFAPLGLLPSRLAYLNLRNHRKILVVDGKIGFTGGMNISARHLLKDPLQKHRVADIHFRMQGPIVSELQSTFVEDWFFATRKTLSGDAYFPPLSFQGDAIARGISSGPDEDLDRLYWTVLGACQTARTSLQIMTPYFIPTPAMIASINCTSLRGVDVTLYLPRSGDQAFVQWATSAYLWQFLQHNVKVIRHGPPFAHSKLMVVDHQWVLLGSGNLDPRSLRLNFEFNVEVYDPDLAKKMETYMIQTAEVGQGERLTLSKMDSRPLWMRLRDGFTKLFSPYL